MFDWIVALPRNVKRAVGLCSDLVLIPLTLWLALCLRLDQLYVPDPRVATAIGLTTLATVALFIRIGLYHAVIRFVGSQVLTTIFIGISFSALALAFFGFLLQAELPRSVPFIYFGLSVIAVGGTRLGLRALLTADIRRGQEKVVIYGAGAAGVQLATALAQGVEYQPVAFLDDDPRKRGTIVQDIPVYRPSKLGRLIREQGVARVFLAISSLSSAERARILQFLTTYEVSVKIIPSYHDIAAGKADIGQLRDVGVDDLLGRDSVAPRQELLDAAIKDKVVMVTGAGGSIGSELCRQIARLKPRKLVLFELSEYSLYAISEELRALGMTDQDFVPVLGSVQDRAHLSRVIHAYGIKTLYHAAAYKHVPIVEHNIVSGVRNNVFGTLNAALAAMEGGVERFILISTDKAVRPTNLMGATKRFAELILQSLATPDATTRFSMVRFGNVLGSSGSVVPLFTRQIRAGGPVTVTHPDITRYFMTIPEAVQLVLQASAMATGGEVFVLDMGEPVKILRLAETMVRLMGKSVRSEANPEGDIEIQFTGLRPGEKLYEELLIGTNCVGTDHPMITRAIEQRLDRAVVEANLDRIRQACDDFNHTDILTIVRETVAEYQPQPSLHDYMYQQTRTSNVVPYRKS